MYAAVETSTKIKSIAPEVAKQFLEDYYHKLKLRVEKMQTDEHGRGGGRGGKSKAKRRCVSFNQADLQKHKMKGGSSEVREPRTHIRRMSVDVGLFLGQKGLQVKSCKSPQELSPTLGNVTMAVACERDKQESMKHGSKKKGNKKLKRSFKMRSAEEDEADDPSSSQIPALRTRQGRFRRSLRKGSSEEINSFESGSMVSIVENTMPKNKPAAGSSEATEKKSKLAASFPRRQWSWKSRKTESEPEFSHQRSSSEGGDGQRSSTTSSKEDGVVTVSYTHLTLPTIYSV